MRRLGRWTQRRSADAVERCRQLHQRTGFVFALLVLYVQLKLRVYGWGETVWWGAQGYLAALLICLPYLALCAWGSAMLDSPFASLAVCFLLVGIPVLLVKTMKTAVPVLGDTWERLLPWGWKYDLLAPELGSRLAAYGMMLVFTALFLWLGARTFSKRDV